MGANIYVNGPRYTKGHSVVLALAVLAIIISVVLMVVLSRMNKKRDEILADYAQRGERHPHMDKSLEDECDFHINFRYTL